MTAAEAMRLARDAGVNISVDGGDLVLDAEREPPVVVLQVLKRHKAEIMEMLTAYVSNPADRIADYRERLVICAEAGDVSPSEAHRIATDQCGAPLEELTDWQIAYWRQCLLRISEPTTHRLNGTRQGCLDTLDEPWLRNAIALGWSELELWGVDPSAPQLTARNGLVTGLYLSALKQPVRVVSINDVHAIIEAGTGARLTHRARIMNKGPVIWQKLKGYN